MFESNVRQQFKLQDGQVITEELFGIDSVPDNSTVTSRSVAMGFDCGVPPEPSVSCASVSVNC